MIVLLVGGPFHDKMMSVDSEHPWLTEDGELRMPVNREETEFAIYVKVDDVESPTRRELEILPTARHQLGAYKFSRMWTRPEEVTLVTAPTT